MTKIFEKPSFFHFGIAVDNLEKYLKPLSKLFPNGSYTERVVSHEYMEHLVGGHKQTVKIAMFEYSPQQFIELLEWNFSKEQIREENVLTATGVSHLCVYVDDAEGFYRKARDVDSVSIIGDRITKVPLGPNKGSLVFFLRINELLYLEIFQKNFTTP